MKSRDCCHMTDIAYVWSLGASSCLEKGVIYNAAPEDKTVIDRKETKYKILR